MSLENVDTELSPSKFTFATLSTPLAIMIFLSDRKRESALKVTLATVPSPLARIKSSLEDTDPLSKLRLPELPV